MVEELKPCPFCASKNIEVHTSKDLGNTKCRCLECFSNGADFDNRLTAYRGNEATQRAIEAWNKRADNSSCEG